MGQPPGDPVHTDSGADSVAMNLPENKRELFLEILDSLHRWNVTKAIQNPWLSACFSGLLDNNRSIPDIPQPAM
jgi:hypothetical protein